LPSQFYSSSSSSSSASLLSEPESDEEAWRIVENLMFMFGCFFLNFSMWNFFNRAQPTRLNCFTLGTNNVRYFIAGGLMSMRSLWRVIKFGNNAFSGEAVENLTNNIFSFSICAAVVGFTSKIFLQQDMFSEVSCFNSRRLAPAYNSLLEIRFP